MSKEDAYELLKAIAEITGQTNKLHIHEMTEEENRSEKLAESIRKSNFSFSALGIAIGEELEFINNPDIKVKVIDDRKVEYLGEYYYLSPLAKILLNISHPVQGSLYFTYNGEVLNDLRTCLERND